MRFRDILEQMEERTETEKIEKEPEVSAETVMPAEPSEREEEILAKRELFWRAEDLRMVHVEDERSFLRLETNLRAVVIPMEHFGTGEQTARVLNISAGGAGIGTKYQCCRGDRLLLKADLLAELGIRHLFCQVERIEKKGVAGFVYGCRFIELTKEEQERMDVGIRRLRLRMRGVT